MMHILSLCLWASSKLRGIRMYEFNGKMGISWKSRATEHSCSVLPGGGDWDVTTLSGQPALVARTIVAACGKSESVDCFIVHPRHQRHRSSDRRHMASHGRNVTWFCSILAVVARVIGDTQGH
jgi:hypothetical protein